MAYPTVTVEIAFDDGPYVLAPTWTDVTSYVREISVNRGRTDELQNFDAGTASVTLDNRDRRFDPFHTTGPYYGKLLPRRQIRITGTVSGTTYPVYRGFIDSWPVTITDAGYDSTVALECFDIMGLIAQTEMEDDLSSAQILGWGPRHYWPLDDPIDPTNPAVTVWRDLGSQPLPITVTNSVANRIANLDGLAPGLPDTCLSISSGEPEVLTESTSNTTGFSVGVSFMGWFLLSDPSSSAVITQFGVSGIEVEASYVPGGTFDLNIWTGTGIYQYKSSTAYFDITIPHHIGISIASGTTPVVYIDAQPISWTSFTSGAFTLAVQEYVAFLNGRHQQVAIFTGAALAQVFYSIIYNMGRNVISEDSASRFSRVLDAAIPTGTLASSVSAKATQQLYEITPGGPPVLQELQLLSDSEGGNLYVSRNGTLTMTARRDIFAGRSLTSQATFGGAGISIAPQLSYRLGADNLRNQLTIGFSGDGTVEIEDATSMATYGQSGGTWSTQLATVDAAEDLAGLIVGFGKTPTMVIEPYEVNVAAVTADWATCLALELLDRVTVNIVPKTGATITQAQIVQSIQHQITPGQWRMTINGSTRYTNPFIIGQSLLGGTDLLV